MKAETITLSSGSLSVLHYNRKTDFENPKFTMKKVIWDIFYADEAVENVSYILKASPRKSLNDLLAEFNLYAASKENTLFFAIPGGLNIRAAIGISDAKSSIIKETEDLKKNGFCKVFWGNYLKSSGNTPCIFMNKYTKGLIDKWLEKLILTFFPNG